MLPAEQINPFRLPFVAFEDRFSLPEKSGLYFPIKDNEILYIGKSRNLRKRLARHEHGSLFDYLGSVRVAWLEVQNGEIDQLEAKLIRLHRPKLDANHVPIEKPKPEFQPITCMVNVESDMLTVSKVAERIGAAERSVRLWAKEGKFPGAKLINPPAGVSYWLIPDTALEGFELRGRGRPPKPKEETKKAKGKQK